MENISKIVISVNDAKEVGYILNIALEGLSKIGYVVVEQESENEFLLKNEDILAVSKDAVMIEDASRLIFVPSEDKTMIGLPVFDETGVFYGVIEKLIFKKNHCEKLITDCCEIKALKVKTIGDVVILSFKRGRKNTLQKQIFPRQDVETQVKIQSNLLPEKVSLSTNFYLGKISTENIYGYNNEKIINKNEIVTRSVVEKAKKHNKLNQLFFALKK